MTSLLLVGCGKMGGALMARWQSQYHVSVIEPGEIHAPHAHVASYAHLESLPASFTPDAVIFAVKPQTLPSLLPEYAARFTHHHTLFLSIAAGKPLAFYTQHLGEHAHIVRAMPNTPALIGQGMTALVASENTPAASRHLASSLMQAVGEVAWLDDESLMDAVTAISGSGPAYVFLFIDYLVQAGVRAGLSELLARKLATRTLAGSGLLAEHSHESLAELRHHVTSPNGVTEAAIKALDSNGELQILLRQTIDAAIKRSKELAG